jgi:hypothetical protein
MRRSWTLFSLKEISGKTSSLPRLLRDSNIWRVHLLKEGSFMETRGQISQILSQPSLRKLFSINKRMCRNIIRKGM